MDNSKRDREGNLLITAYGSFEKKVYFKKKLYKDVPQRDENAQIIPGYFKQVWEGDLEDRVFEFNENHANQVIRNSTAYVEIGKPAKLKTVGKVTKPKRSKKDDLASGVISEKGGEVKQTGVVHKTTISDDGTFMMIE